MEVLHLNQASFDKVISQTEKAVLIDFWATWCGPCKMLAPVLESFAAAHEDVIVGKVDVDSDPELAAKFSVDSIPALFFFRNGKLEKRLVGYMDQATLTAKLGL